MSAFEFVFTLLSVVASLAITHLVSGIVNMIRATSRPSWFLGVWLWIAFATTIGNWGATWGAMGTQTTFPPWEVLLVLATVIGQYVFCALVIPSSELAVEAPPGEARQKERTRFVGAYMGLIGLALVANVGLGLSRQDLFQSFWGGGLCLVQIALAAMALWGPWRWARMIASFCIAALSTFWMLLAIHIVANP
jgi:hypothetical protein